MDAPVRFPRLTAVRRRTGLGQRLGEARPERRHERGGFVVNVRLLLVQRRLHGCKLSLSKAKAAADVLPARLHLHREHLKETHAAVLHRLDERVRAPERRTLAPEPEPLHVRHVANLADARGGAVHDPRVRAPPLQLDDARRHLTPRLGPGVEVLSLVALVQ